MPGLSKLANRLYTGELSIDFVGRRRLWYIISATIVVVAIAALFLRPLNFGIEFEGGVEFRAKVSQPTSEAVPAMREAVASTGLDSDPVVVSSGDDGVRVQTEELNAGEIETVTEALEEAGATSVSSEFVGPSWGQQVANRALLGLSVFLVLVVLFIGLYFREWKMSFAAIVALAHDVVITVGVYALTGFEVTPATITGLLTILGYSLYDTVVVFDKVRENTRGVTGSSRRTYAESANLAVNQTLVRSINTSIAALLPVAAILYVGVTQLGSGPLKDLALALLVGMAAGTYSSICLATPLLVQLKEREPAVREQARRVAARRAEQPPLVGAQAAQASAAPAGRVAVRRPMSTGTAKRSQPKRTSRAQRGKDQR
jgi:preprotein translocase subunit SecF